jgi:ubiquinone/menaquinone biosynthesis C-methylase UbiE
MTNVFFEIHSGLPREGPGDEASTARAFGLIRGLPANPDVLDVGCGPGAQTLALASLTGSLVTAVDNHVLFLDDLRGRAGRAGFAGRIRTVQASMFELPFNEASFDLIWSEGAIYQMGFDNGLRSWRRFLRPGGWIAVTEVAWLRDDPPAEIFEFWQAGYPGIRSIADNLTAIRGDGYETAGHFVLPDSCWWDSYYVPILEKLPRLREKYRGDAEALGVIDQETLEVELFKKYSAYYGYVFFVMKRTG